MSKDASRRDRDPIGDSFPNDYLEALILFVIGLGLFSVVVLVAKCS